MKVFALHAHPTSADPSRSAALSRRSFVLCTVASAALAACGGSGDDTELEQPSGLTITQFADGSTQVAGGGGLTVSSIVGGSALFESVLSTAAGEHRVFYDADGRAKAIRLADGHSLHLAYPRSGRVDMVLVDAAGLLQWGAALYEQAGQLMFAPLGSSLGASQINATISGPLNGALTVNADAADPLAGIDTARAAAVSANLVSALTAGADASAAPPGRAFSLAATAGQQIAAGIMQAGVLAPVLGYAGLQLGAAVLTGAAAPAVLAAAGSVLLIGASAYALSTGLSNIRNGAVRALEADSLDALAEERTQSSLFDRIASAVDSIASTGQALAERALDTITQAAASGESSPAAAGFGSLPAVTGALAGVATQVRGVLVDTAGRLFSGTGLLNATDMLSLALSAGDGTALTVSAQRTGSDVNGSYTVNGQTGAVSGTSGPIGQCNTSSSSGGQGTFSYAYNVGNGTGAFPFSYEMYSIPDQARIVDTAGRELFNTGGLVSGSSSLTVLLAGEANVVVLINAPNSGTAWDFTIGCSS